MNLPMTGEVALPLEAYRPVASELSVLQAFQWPTMYARETRLPAPPIPAFSTDA